MKALLLSKPGSLDNIAVGQSPVPEAANGEVLVRVHAVGLNPVDYKLVLSGFPSWSYPHIPGVDVAGVVEAVTQGVILWKPGDRVYFHGNLSKPGGLAEFSTAPGAVLASIPAGVDFVEAAALPCAGFTGYQLVYDKIRLEPDETVLIQGGAGGVGGFCIQLAKHAGARVITTCSESNFEYVRKLGTDEVIDYKKENLEERVHELTGGTGLDALIDAVGAEPVDRGMRLLRFGGRIAFVTNQGHIDTQLMFERAISLHAVLLGGAYLHGTERDLENLGLIARKMMELLGAGIIDPMIEKIITLEESPQALNSISGGHSRGKIVARLI